MSLKQNLNPSSWLSYKKEKILYKLFFFFFNAAKSLQSYLTLATPWMAANQAPPSLGFSRQEHWSGLPGEGTTFTTLLLIAYSIQFSSVTQSCPTLCDPMNRSMPGLPVHHPLPEFTQTHVHRVGDAIKPSHPLSCPSPPAPKPSQHQGLFQ